jgi:hypothetical protein
MNSRLTIAHINTDLAIGELDAPQWKIAKPLSIQNYWSGEKAIADRHFMARAVWSMTALYFQFEAAQTEPLVVNDQPDVSKKTVGLWERDVCEVFIAPDRNEPRKYFEFEVAPTGEWLDLAIDTTRGHRVTDWEYGSGLDAASHIEDGRILMSMKIPWQAFGQKPKVDDVWLGNIFRCVGGGPDRGYLAWNPTLTTTPNFHVPERFGQLIFEN